MGLIETALRPLGAPYHVGLAVADLDSAVRVLSAVLETEFTGLQDVAFDGYALRYVFSLDGPSYLELCEGTENSPWYARQGIQVHHLGFWTPDLDNHCARLERAGLKQEWLIDGSGRRAAYYREPGGLLVELVDESRRVAFEELIEGGRAHDRRESS